MPTRAVVLKAEIPCQLMQVHRRHAQLGGVKTRAMPDAMLMYVFVIVSTADAMCSAYHSFRLLMFVVCLDVQIAPEVISFMLTDDMSIGSLHQ